MHVTDCIKRAKRTLGGCGTWGTCPPREIFDFRPSEIVFGAVLGLNSKSWMTNSNVVIVFEHSHNLKVWIRFAPRHGKIFSASYCMFLFSHCSVELRDTNIVCHRILLILNINPVIQFISPVKQSSP